MLEVKFYDTVDDSLLKFAVIISQSNGKWVFCKHKERDTYEAPGGHREVGEDILETAKRELQEETGAIQFDIKPICVYSVTGKNNAVEETEAGESGAELQSSGILSLFRECGWLLPREIGRNDEYIANISIDCRKLMDFLRKMTEKSGEGMMSNRIFSMYEIIKSAFE